jgi:hypothetical protein
LGAVAGAASAAGEAASVCAAAGKAPRSMSSKRAGTKKLAGTGIFLPVDGRSERSDAHTTSSAPGRDREEAELLVVKGRKIRAGTRVNLLSF